jgi:hypothetical protein
LGRTLWFQNFPYCETARRGQDQLKLFSSYRKSRFANLPEPLLGYSQDIPQINHITQSRMPYLNAVAGDALRSGNLPLLAQAAIQQIGRAAIGMAAIHLGRGERLLARRFHPATTAELTTFYAVAATLSE